MQNNYFLGDYETNWHDSMAIINTQFNETVSKCNLSDMRI